MKKNWSLFSTKTTRIFSIYSLSYIAHLIMFSAVRDQVKKFFHDDDAEEQKMKVFVVVGLGFLFVSLKVNPIQFGKNLIKKTRLYVLAVSHLLLSNEKKGLKALQKEMDFDEDSIKSQSKLKGTRTIYFLRHGESQWNYVFNRGFGVSFPLRLARGLVMELMCLFNARNSFFVDAPLSDRGLEQVEELRKFLNKVNDPFLTDAEVAALRSKHVDVLRADAAKGEKLSKKSIIVTSNLRRAAHTAAITFMDRFERTKEKLFVNDALQEMARNVDAFALAGEAFDAVPYTGITNVAKDKGTLNTIVEETVKFDVESNAGNKGIGRRGATDCLRFAHWATSPSAVPKECEAIIATGHSIYFKEFFKLFLPSASKHDAKSKKIVNCGVIAFELKKYEHEKKGVFYSIDENSIETVYGGFVQKGKH